MMPELRAQKLAKSIRSRAIVQQVSLSVEGGSIVGLLGPNGAGKTTLFCLLVGLIRPDAGEIFFNKQNIETLRIDQRALLGIAYLPQEPSVFRKMTVYDNVASVLEFKGLKPTEIAARTQTLLEEFKLWNLQNQLGLSLSGGERRRLEIARTLALNPSIILLDEPFAGVDPISVIEIKALIKKIAADNIGVLITDHNVRETLNICHRAYIMNQGKMLANGTPDELLNNHEVREIYLGQEFKL